MDNSNLAGQKCPHGQCVHGMCHNHGPERENVGEKRCEPNPGIFGKKTYWTRRHCGQLMAQYKEVQTRKCRKCGRTEDNITNYYLALCLCCGYHFTNVSSVSSDY